MSTSIFGRHLQELFWRKGARSHSRHEDGALEVEGLVDPGSDRRTAHSLWSELNFAGTLQFIIDIITEQFAVVDSGNAKPLSERMQHLAIQQGLGFAIRCGEAVQTPLPVDDADLKEHPVLSIFTGIWIHFLQMEEALRWSTVSIRPEYDLPGEARGSSQRVHVNEERVFNAVELDSFSVRRLNQTRMPEGRYGMPTE